MTTKVKKPKLDIMALIGPLEEEVKPRTLMEIYEEVGLPFSARAISDHFAIGDENSPIGLSGSEVTALSLDQERDLITSINPYIAADGRRCPAIKGIVPRWVLLGHK